MDPDSKNYCREHVKKHRVRTYLNTYRQHCNDIEMLGGECHVCGNSDVDVLKISRIGIVCANCQLKKSRVALKTRKAN